jgi:REP element-mobilizing transposase RayT
MKRPKHVQQEMTFRTWGGRRAGAGRKRRPGRKAESHRTRKSFSKDHPLHIVLRVASEVGSLRKRDCYGALRGASFAVLGRPDFRIVHISIQATHVHLLVEAADKHELARGMKAFEISAAKRLNAAISRRTGARRRGRVFVDRYHREVIDNPRQARHCLAYVLNNWRKHGEHLRGSGREWKLDPYSTAMAFYGWAEQPLFWRAPETYERLGVSMPETWLLYGAWRALPPISMYATPSAR